MWLLWLAIYRLHQAKKRPLITAELKVERTQRVEHSTLTDDVISALMNLGYKKKVAQRAVTEVVGNGWTTFDDLFRAALRRAG
jgi:Holliday junction resolvasome RuvABC DNA-binding subunit